MNSGYQVMDAQECHCTHAHTHTRWHNAETMVRPTYQMKQTLTISNTLLHTNRHANCLLTRSRQNRRQHIQFEAYAKIIKTIAWCFVSVSGQRAFRISAPKNWNSLPSDIQLTRSLTVFKERLETFLFLAACNQCSSDHRQVRLCLRTSWHVKHRFSFNLHT